MVIQEFEDKVRALSVRQLEAALRFLNGGPLGYDYRKTGPVGANGYGTFSKADLQNRLIKIYAPAYATRNVVNANTKSIAEVWDDIQDALTNDQRAKARVASELAGTIVSVTGLDILDARETMLGRLGRDEGLEGQTETDGVSGGGGTKESEGMATTDGQEGPGKGNGQGEAGFPQGEGQGMGASEGGLDNSEADQVGNNPSQSGDGDSGPESGNKSAESSSGEEGKESLADAIKREVADSVAKTLEKSRGMKPKDMKALVKLIQEELDKRAKVYRIEVKNPEDSTKDSLSDEKPRHEIFREFLEAVNAGENVLLVGPAGCGKTWLAREASEIMGKQFGFTGAVSTEHKLLGYTDAHGRLVRTVYRDSYEKGWWFLWDELDASGAQPMLSFNAGLANGHQDFPDGIVSRHKDFRAIASANTYGHGADRQYVGRNQLDAASLDRFYVIPMDYDEKLELALYGACEWVKFVQQARKAVRKLGLRHVVSMRAIESGLRMLKTGAPRADVERGALWKHLVKDDVARVKGEMFGRAV